MNNKETWKLVGISKATFYKYKKQLLVEYGENLIDKTKIN